MTASKYKTVEQQQTFINNLKAFVVATGYTISKIFNKIYDELEELLQGAIADLQIENNWIEDIKQTIYEKLIVKLKAIDFNQIKQIYNYLFIMIKRLIINELEKVNNYDKVIDSFQFHRLIDGSYCIDEDLL